MLVFQYYLVFDRVESPIFATKPSIADNDQRICSLSASLKFSPNNITQLRSKALVVTVFDYHAIAEARQSGILAYGVFK